MYDRMSKKGLKNVDVYTLCAHKSGHNSGLKDQQDIIKMLPDMSMALLNRGARCETGESRRREVRAAPVPCPIRVTESGSPPN